MRYCIIFLALFFSACGGTQTEKPADTAATTSNPWAADSIARANLIAEQNRNSVRDTAFHTALPPVFEGDIIMQNLDAPQANLLHELAGGKYNHVGMIYQRPKDGMLMVVDLQDSVRVITLTEFVDRSNGQVCLLRVKNANVTLTEEKTRALFAAAKAYKGRPFDPVLNWDDSGMYSSELVWKIYNNAMRLTLCPTRKVGDFNISAQKKAELKKQYGKEVSDKDEAVSPDDIYNSKKLEIIYEK